MELILSVPLSIPRIDLKILVSAVQSRPCPPSFFTSFPDIGSKITAHFAQDFGPPSGRELHGGTP